MGVPDGNVPEWTAVHTKKVIRPKPALATHPPVSRPGFATWEEVRGYVFQIGVRNGFCDLFPMAAPLRIHHVSVEIPCHQ